LGKEAERVIRKRDNRYVVELYDPTTRTKRYIGSTGKLKDARTLEAQAKLKRRALSDVRVGPFAERWLREFPRPEPTTQKHYTAMLKPFIRDFQGRRLDAIGRSDARGWAMENRGSLPVVRAMFNDAIDIELIETNPFQNLRLPQSRGRKDVVALTEPELYALADKAVDVHEEYGKVIRAAVLFAGYTGVRAGELMALQWTDVDLAHQELTVSRQTRTDGTAPPKNKRARTVILPPPAKDALLSIPRMADWLFVSPQGRPFTKTSFYYWWNPVRKAAGRPGFAFHELRHAAATILLERGLSAPDVALQLGHTDGGRLVQALYGHPSEDRARERLKMAFTAERERLGGLIKELDAEAGAADA